MKTYSIHAVNTTGMVLKAYGAKVVRCPTEVAPEDPKDLLHDPKQALERV